MPQRSRDVARVGASLTIAATHLVLMVLAMIDRLAYTVPPSFQFIAISANNPIWIFLHGAVGLYILFALKFKHDEMFNAMGAAAGVMGCWSLINLCWGLAPVRSVSLAGPVLATGMALIAYFLARAWIKVGDHETRR